MKANTPRCSWPNYMLKAKCGGRRVLLWDGVSRRASEFSSRKEARECAAKQWHLRREMAEGWARGHAKALERVKQFEDSRATPNFSEALDNYTAALWGWIHAVTPGGVMEKLACAEVGLRAGLKDDSAVGRWLFQYLLERAVFLTGLQHEKGRTIHWWEQLPRLSDKAVRLGDLEFFTAMQQRDRDSRKEQKFKRQALNLHLLCHWLASGMWCAPSRSEQWAILKATGWMDCAPSLNSLALSHGRLGLRWFKEG